MEYLKPMCLSGKKVMSIWFIDEEGVLRFNEPDEGEEDYEIVFDEVSPIFSKEGLIQLATIFKETKQEKGMMTLFEDLGYGECQTTFTFNSTECVYRGKKKIAYLFTIITKTIDSTRIYHVIMVETVPVLIHTSYDDGVASETTFKEDKLPTIPASNTDFVSQTISNLLAKAK